MLLSLRARFFVLLTSLVLIPRGSLYAGLNAWTGGGPPGEFVNAILADPSNPDTLFAATNRGIYKSTDDGRHWASMNNGLSSPYVGSLAVSSSSGVLYAAVDGVYKSVDGAESWAKLPYPRCGGCIITPTVLAVDPSDPSTLYAAAYRTGVLKTIDGGATWQQTGSLRSDIVALAIDRNDPKTVYAADLGAPIVLPSGIHPASATESSTDQGTIYKTTDGGAHWTPGSGGLAGGYVWSVAIDPANSSTLYAGTSSGIFKSVNAGSSWRAAARGPATQVNSFSFDPSDAAIYAGTADGIFKSQDGGETWDCWNRGLGGRHVLGLARTAGSNFLFAGTEGGGVYMSEDDGASWSAANGGFVGANVASVAVDPSSPTTVYAGVIGGGVFRSEDGGASWAYASTGFTDTVIHSLAVVPGAPGLVYAGTDQGVFKSLDRARSWGPTRAGLTMGQTVVVRVDPTSGRVYAAQDTGVAWTADGGITWTFGGPGGRNRAGALEIDPADPATLYAAIGGLFRSTDHGMTWSKVETPAQGISSIAIAPGRPGTIYLGGFGIFLSRDGGGTWIGPVGPRQGITSLVVNPSEPSIVYAGTDCSHGSIGCGEVFRTTDGGETWTAFSEGLANAGVNALAIDQTGTSLYAGTQAGVFSRNVPLQAHPPGDTRKPPRRVTLR